MSAEERPENAPGGNATDAASAEQYDLTNLTESSFMFEQIDMVYKPPDKVVMEDVTVPDDDKSCSDSEDEESRSSEAPSSKSGGDGPPMSATVSPIKDSANQRDPLDGDEDLNGTVLASQADQSFGPSPPATVAVDPSAPPSRREENGPSPSERPAAPQQAAHTFPEPKQKGVKFSSESLIATFQTSGPANKLNRSTPVRAKTLSTHKVVRDPTPKAPQRQKNSAPQPFQAPLRRPVPLNHQPRVGFSALPTPPRRVAYGVSTPRSTRPFVPGPRKDTPHPFAQKSRSLILKPSRKQLETEGVKTRLIVDDDERSPPPPSILRRKSQASQAGEPAESKQNDAETVSRLRSLIQGVKEKHGGGDAQGEDMILDSPVQSRPAAPGPTSLFSIPEERTSVAQPNPEAGAQSVPAADPSGVSKIRDVNCTTASAKICSDMSRLDRHLKATKSIGIQTTSETLSMKRQLHRRASVGFLPESPIPAIRARSRQRRSKSLNIPQFEPEFVSDPANQSEEMDMNKALDTINTNLKSPFDRWKKGSSSEGKEEAPKDNRPVPIDLSTPAHQNGKKASAGSPVAPAPGGGLLLAHAPSTGPAACDSRRRSGTKRPRLSRHDEGERPNEKRLRLSAPKGAAQQAPSSAPPMAAMPSANRRSSSPVGTPDNPGGDSPSDDEQNQSVILKQEKMTAELVFQNPNTNYECFAHFK